MNLQATLNIDAGDVFVFGTFHPYEPGQKGSHGVPLEPDYEEYVEFDGAEDEFGAEVMLTPEEEGWAIDALWAQMK